ncbi:hypothetical protein K438DRAFT_1929891 [Mycena galopus ATCC 62051]|nr:hypothetical protein K438DRAFT_1929891 [Mycena galopus ATCC 62051]
MSYDRARKCRRLTEVNGRGFRNMDMDHYTTARFKGMKEEGKGDGRGLPEVKAGKLEEKCRRPGEVRFLTSPVVGCETEVESISQSTQMLEEESRQRRMTEGQTTLEMELTLETGMMFIINLKHFIVIAEGQMKSDKSPREDRNVKPEEDGDDRKITGSHLVVVRMSSGVEPEVNRRRPGVGRTLTGS